ncbi:VWA domain-containing protein [Maribacter algarum]|uniref:VWA domain-containing protein n=1 Tax=Maribacter algarum (ex Zhang et al. 2020) TaxID=2578118 RepID=A0A5S3PRZ3_9FLAO|nr:vWA domain-containing protein [Maribacter algarum]TMM57431.1 VWA domain-containing protein [Maribacter algarum]
MQTSTVLLIILAAIVALGMVLFQYYYNSKKRGKLNALLSFLRFIGLFGLFILLINPKFSKNEYSLEKTNLILLTDNSSSLADSKEKVQEVLNKLKVNASLVDKFSVAPYHFGNSVQQTDSLSFLENNTNISKAINSLDEIYANTNSTMVLLTDGNSTIGQDYIFSGRNAKLPIYPIAIGDTTQYEDLRINQVNSNKYAFLKNKYPLEIYVSYDGSREVNSTVSIKVNGNTVYRENTKLSNTNSSKTIKTNLDAGSVGIKSIQIELSTLDGERNKENNIRNAVVEVIDEKTNIAIISSMIHPDIGTLRKAIESNEQRSVSIKKPTANLKDFDDVDVFLLYQPNPSFTTIYTYLKQKKASVFTIGGTKTNWSTINKASRKYNLGDGYPIQEVIGVLNPSFSKFDITDFTMDDFPPLDSNAGGIKVDGAETLVQMKVFGATLKSPLLFALDNENGKEIVLTGENIWKWRMQSFRNNQNFQNFDDFIGKLMLYLSSNKGKNRLDVDYKSVYEGSNDAKIKASYFDEAFVFDSNASLVVKLKNTESGSSQEIPMLLKNNFYEADLSDLPPGQYAFIVNVEQENRKQSGSFTILDFDVEKQFLSTNYKKLRQLASTTNGKLYFPNNMDDLVQSLLNDSRFVPTQKATKNIVSLIDFRVLLAIIIAALAAEWFIRKYNGLT